MSPKAIRSIKAVGLGAALVAWSLVPGPRAPLTQASLAAGLAALTRAPLGLRPPALWAGLRTGAAAGSVVAAVVAAGTAIAPVRAGMSGRTPPASPVNWLAFRIPVGTVWSEEAAYRGALATLSAAAYGPRAGALLQALAFGLSHIADARSAGESVAGTVAVTAAAGWVFARLAEHSGSLAAPMLAHLAVNEAGAIATLALQSTSRSDERTADAQQ